MPFLFSFNCSLILEGSKLSERKKQEETKKVESTTMFSDPPVHEEETLRQDVERKREEIKNSTIGGF